MTLERLRQLQRECHEDLAEAKRQGHEGWILTLKRRLWELNRMLTRAEREAVVPRYDPFTTATWRR